MTACGFKDILHSTNRIVKYGIVMSLQVMGRFFCRPSDQARLADCKNILVIRLDEIGDIVLMSPFLRELRRGYPDAHITLVVKPAVYNLVELCPYVDRILTFSPIHGRGSFYIRLWKMVFFAHRHFKASHFDMALVPRFDSDEGYGAGLLAFFSGAVRRIGYSEHVLSSKETSDRGYDGFYTDVLQVESADVRHEVERNLDMLRFIGVDVIDTSLEMWMDETDKRKATELLSGVSSNAVKIAVVLSAGRKEKEWPVASYLSVLRQIRKRYSVQIVLLGAGQSAISHGQMFYESAPDTINLVDQTTLRETVEILRNCDCYLGGDTGPMHLAATVQKHGVVLFANRIEWMKEGIDTPERFGPWGAKKMRVLQPQVLSGYDRGGEAHFITQISVGEVEEVMRRIIKGMRS